MTGKNDPLRSLGIRSSRSPAWVASSRSRAPLRSVTRDSVRSYRPAPILSVASASISSCMTIRTDSRIRSTPSPVRNASSRSDTADWDKAIGGDPFGECLAVHTEDLAGGPHTPGAAPITAKTPPRHGTLTRQVVEVGQNVGPGGETALDLDPRRDARGRPARWPLSLSSSRSIRPTDLGQLSLGALGGGRQLPCLAARLRGLERQPCEVRLAEVV